MHTANESQVALLQRTCTHADCGLLLRLYGHASMLDNFMPALIVAARSQLESDAHLTKDIAAA